MLKHCAEFGAKVRPNGRLMSLLLSNLIVLALLPGVVEAQVASRTETIEYHDDPARWVMGQTKKVRCTAPSTVLPAGCGPTGTVMSETTYDSTYALPLVRKSFGKTTQTLTWDTTSTIASGQRGTVKTVADGNGHITTVSSWKRGIPQAITYPATPEAPAGATQSAVVNDVGWVTAVVDENGFRTCYAYDAMGRISQVTYPSESAAGVCDTSSWAATTQAFAQVASAEYGIPAGHWRQTISTGNGRKITYYDGLWRPLVVREYDTANEAATQRFSRFAYNHRGQPTFAAYPAAVDNPGVGTYTRYDALGRVTQVEHDSELNPGRLTTTTEYLAGFQTRITDPSNHQTTTSYRAWDTPIQDYPTHIAHPEGAHTHISRDVFGKVTQLRRSNSSSASGGTGIDRSYTYNAHQELCRSVEPETGATLMGYDGAGNLTWSAAGLPGAHACEANGSTPVVAARRVGRQYDARNRLATLSFPDGRGNQSWTYTPDGLPATITTHNASGTDTVSNSYGYNRRRLLTQETMTPDAIGTWALGYAYNANGHLSRETYPAGLTTYYTVNALGQATQITAQDATTVNVVSNAVYAPSGALQSFTYGNGIIHSTLRNVRQLPDWVVDCTASTCHYGERVVHQQLMYDRNGNTTRIGDNTPNPSHGRDMRYDALNRLTQTTSTAFGTAHYTYDVLDNLTRVQVGASALYPARDHGYCYTDNRLTAIRAANCSGSLIESLTYDLQGNLSNKGSQAFSFDFGNRLRASGGSSQYRYDGHGRRVRHTASGTSPHLYSQYDSSGKLRWQRDEVNNQRIRHIYLGNRLVAEHRKPLGSNTPTIEYVHVDALGSPIARTDANQTIIVKNVYEPYGRMVNRANDDRPGYTGHVMDSATGLTYMQQRYYDPTIGRFLSVDPVTANSDTGANFNRYWYANNNPYLFTDPDGRCPDGPKTGTRICGGGAGNNVSVIHMSPSGGGGRQSGGSSEQDQPSSSSPVQQSSTGAPTPDGRIPVPGVIGWKTGEYDMSRTSEELDSAGLVISGAAVVGGGAIAIQAVAPRALIASTKSTWRNLSFDGPSSGGWHANGRLLGIRWKGGQWGIRLDLHPVNSGSIPILHINYGPAARGEAGHLILFDPRWIKRSGE